MSESITFREPDSEQAVDRKNLLAFASLLKSLALPEVTSPAGKAAVANARLVLDLCARQLRDAVAGI